MENNPDIVRHVVVFKFKPGTPAGHIEHITDAFRALQRRIPGIRSFEQGFNMSPEGLDQGFTHVYTLTFDSAPARDAYLPHPDHQAFGALLKQLDCVAGVFVVDYNPAP